MSTGLVMHGKRLIIFCFLLLPSVSFSDGPEEFTLTDVVIRNAPAGEDELSNSDFLSVNQHQKDINITIQKNGEQIIVDVYFTVPVSSQWVWETLTDFDNTHSFISSVQSSKVINRTGNTLHVTQKSIIRVSVATFNFESVREVNLVPFKEINERMISGNMRKMEEITQIIPKGDQTRISYHANIIPDIWIFKYIGHVFIEDAAREQFREIRDEIIRRKKTGYRPGMMKNTLRHIQNSERRYNFP
jgi:carbon monoxide dehydrogenase subunit G